MPESRSTLEFVSALRAEAPGFKGTLEFDAPLAKVAYYRIGGPASVLATPRTFEDLALLHRMLRAHPVPFFILGWGSNLLFSDEGFQGLVIRMKHLNTGVEEDSPGQLRVGASLGASALLRVASEKGYGGLARLTGIPGSVGGMIAMNAGTHLGEMGDLVVQTGWVNLNEDREELTLRSRIHVAGDFSYRRNHFLSSGDLVLHSRIRYEPADPAAVKREIDDLYQRRKATQPVEYPSCGSVFMNPGEGGLRAWQVVERLGLRGHRVGNAQISEKHPNFIVNLGGATANEVKALIALVKSRARAELGIEMHEEVKVLA